MILFLSSLALPFLSPSRFRCVCASVCVLPYLRSRSKSRRDPKSSEYAPRLFSGILIANFTVSVCLSVCVCVCMQVRVCFKVLCFNENLHAECLIFSLAPYLGVALPVPFPLPSPKVATKMQNKVISAQIALSLMCMCKALGMQLIIYVNCKSFYSGNISYSFDNTFTTHIRNS